MFHPAKCVGSFIGATRVTLGRSAPCTTIIYHYPEVSNKKPSTYDHNQEVMSFKYAFLASIQGLFIFYISSVPADSLPGGTSLTKQILFNLSHIPAYALLAFLMLKSFPETRFEKHYSRIKLLILVGTLIFAISDEIHQSFVPGRSSSFIDIGLDIIGIFLGFRAYGIFLAFCNSQDN